MSAWDVRFKDPGTFGRNGSLILYSRVEFFGAYTSCLVECFAWNSAGQNLGYCFTDSNHVQALSSAARSDGSVRTVAVTWVFDNTTVSAQAVYFRAWVYTPYGSILDTAEGYVTP
jgi:hypothetical protein